MPSFITVYYSALLSNSYLPNLSKKGFVMADRIPLHVPLYPLVVLIPFYFLYSHDHDHSY